MTNTKTKTQIRNRIIAIGFAIIIVIVALLLFMNSNTQRITEQNEQFLETSAGQTARRVNDVFTSSLKSIESAAAIYGQMLQNPIANPKDAVSFIDVSQFDHAFFIDADGMAYSSNDMTAYAGDRDYFQQGMAGNSGICFNNDAIFDERNVVDFFAPVRYEDKIIGVLVSAYNEDTLNTLITTEFYGEPTPTYLCLPDGTVVAHASANPDHIGSLAEIFSDGQVEDATEDILENGTSDSISFLYRSSEGVGNAYVTKLPSYDWLLVRSFPPAITNEMVSKANLSGLYVIAGVLIATAIIIIVLMMQARQENKKLLLERQEATRIIDASTNLFNALLSIDLINDTYEFLKNDSVLKKLPTRGSYEQLQSFFQDLLDLDNSEDDRLVFLDTASIYDSLGSNVAFVQQECLTNENYGSLWFQISTLCLARDASGKPISVLIATQDITDAKEKEINSRLALENAFQAAEHASQAKSDFLNSMSHDIRTPMNSIMGLTAIASMHINDPDRVRDCLNNISAASKHLLGLINEVLDMAKIESGTIGLTEEPFDLPESIENLITLMNPQITAKNQVLKVDLGDIQHEFVLGDPTRLQQVFVNIMGNSVKFTPEGGTIGLRIAETPSRIPGSGSYEFTFSDTGCGMSEEFLKTMFDPFVRANDSRTSNIEGTGLGMAIVKSVVSLMNGSIDVTSEEGVGTTFVVRVQLKLRDGEKEDLSKLKDIRVLVVDDDQIACDGACALLEDIGMRSDYALSGQAGIDSIRQAQIENDPFKAVILDWRMPEMSGIEAAKRIREVTQGNVPIIILSAYDWSMIEQEAREVGVDAFISKPLFRSRLIQVMEELLSGEVKEVIDDRAVLEELAYSGKRVLLTEDNVMGAAIAQELIEMTGASVEHAENGKIAVDMLLDHDPGYYDIVLMDIQMPVMNGYESATAIRENGKTRPDLAEIPIVALSADAFAEDVRHAHSAGMNDHMPKPLEINTLVRMLRKWMP